MFLKIKTNLIPSLHSMKSSLLILPLFAASTASAILSYSTDFENFSLGSDTNPANPLFVDPLMGANNWKGNGLSGYDAEIVDVGGSNGQVLRLSNALPSGNFDSTHPTTPFLDPAIGQTGSGGTPGIFRFSFDFSSVLSTEQVGLEVDVSPFASGTTFRQGILRIQDFGDSNGGLTLSWIDYFDSAFEQTFIATGLSRTAWHNVEAELSILNGSDNDIFNITVNSALFAFTLGSWEGFYEDTLAGPKAADSLIFRVPNPTSGLPAVDGNGLYFDNVAISAEVIPEVSAVFILAFSGLLGALRRPRRSVVSTR